MHFINFEYLSSFVMFVVMAFMIPWDVVSTQTVLFSLEGTSLHSAIIEDISSLEYTLEQCVLL